MLITGAGQAFCAGQDLREHAELLEAAGQDEAARRRRARLRSPRRPDTRRVRVRGQPGPGRRRPAGAPAPLDTVREHYNPLVLAIRSMPKPVIAAVNGVAAGAGAGLAFACDFRIAAQGASFLMAFARVGLAADTGVSWTLPRLAGAGRAAELLMLAEPIRAPRALELGLVNQVVADADLPCRRGRPRRPAGGRPDRRLRGHQGTAQLRRGARPRRGAGPGGRGPGRPGPHGGSPGRHARIHPQGRAEFPRQVTGRPAVFVSGPG